MTHSNIVLTESPLAFYHYQLRRCRFHGRRSYRAGSSQTEAVGRSARDAKGGGTAERRCAGEARGEPASRTSSATVFTMRSNLEYRQRVRVPCMREDIPFGMQEKTPGFRLMRFGSDIGRRVCGFGRRNGGRIVAQCSEVRSGSKNSNSFDNRAQTRSNAPCGLCSCEAP